MNNTDNTESIKDLVQNIKEKNIVLPEFQRDFVWGIERTLDLYDSLVREIFIGAIIYGKPAFEITIREIDDRPRRGKGSRRKLTTYSFSREEAKKKSEVENFRLILDGQQRCTSIYRSLTGVDNVWMVLKNDSELEDEIYEKKIEDRMLEEVLYQFSSSESSNRLSIKISDVYEIMNSSFRESQVKEKYFDKLLYPKNFEPEEEDHVFTNFLVYKNKVEDLLKDKKIFNYYMLDMSLEKFALFFERSNSLGIRLNFIDILAAKLYVGFKLRKEIESFENNNFLFKPMLQEVVVRAISYFVSNGRDVSRDFILKNLNFEHFNMYWENLLKCYKQALNFLFDNNYITTQRWIPYENMLIPLIVFSYELKGDFSTMSEAQSKMINFWYWSSIFSLRYSGSSNEVVVQESNALRQLAKDGKIRDKSFFNRITKYQISSGQDIASYNKKRSALYKGVLNYIGFYKKGLIGWQNTTRLKASNNLEDHHIFPKSFIETKYKNDDNAQGLKDSVLNRTLIPKILNIKIGKKSPNEYLNEIKEKDNPKIYLSLENHMIPKDLVDGLYDDFFADFIEERGNSIFDILNKEIFMQKESILKEFYREPSKQGKQNIKVFRTYLGNKFEATFNPVSQKILYNGEEYSVSGAAEKAKSEVKGTDNITANGWKFWKFTDESIGAEKYIEELREE